MSEIKFEDLDLYNLLGITIAATTSEVKKAYRKKALSCHPDKNPDNPKAAELFHELSKALEILIDDSARCAYDKVLKSKAAAKLRHQQLDTRRKKFKEDLEARERAAQEAPGRYGSASETDEEKLQAEIERLRKEGSRLVQEEINYVQSIIEEERKNNLKGLDLHDNTDKRLKIKWDAKKDDDSNGGYNYNILHNMLSKYGNIIVLIVSPKKKGSALVEFETVHSAFTAQQMETGLESNPCIITWLDAGNSKRYSKVEPKLSDLYSETNKQNPSVNEFKPSSSRSYPFSGVGKSPNVITDNDFESLVLHKMRRAQERKDLEESFKKDDKVEDQN